MMIPEIIRANERFPSRAHQLVGVEQLIRETDPTRIASHAGITYTREIPNVFALFDEVGAGKTKQIIDSAQILFMRGLLDTVVVFAPGEARMTWADEDPVLGEIAKHAWEQVHNVIHEFHRGYTELELVPAALNWVISNFEFIRRPTHLAELVEQLRGRHTWLVIDESWNICHFSLQTRACMKFRRKRAERVTILNGTPLADGKPADLYYQFALLDPDIIGTQNRTHFKSKYCIMGGYAGKQVVDYQNLDELNARIAPYVLSRKTRDCFDLPPMLDPVLIEATLKPETWKVYKEMRDDMVTWLDTQVSLSSQAIVKVLRLAQITSGFLGGLETTPGILGEKPEWLERKSVDITMAGQDVQVAPGLQIDGPITREVGREKLEALLKWLVKSPLPEKLLVWCRFRPELERTVKALGALYPRVLALKGGQTTEERIEAKLTLAPGGDPQPTAVVGNQKVGGVSLNLSGCNTAIYLSNGLRLLERTQSVGRIERKGQVSPMRIIDIVATGPAGQKTIDHAILKSIRKKEDMSKWTVGEWRRVLTEP